MQVALLQPQIKITQTAIIDGVSQEVYDARTLHGELQSKKQFSDWIKNRLQDFAENVDFVSFTPNSEKPLGGRPSTEYLLAIDTAKHLSMMEQTEIGKKVRLAFIEAEKELRLKKQAPQIQQLSRLEILEIAIENERKVIALENTVQKQTQEIQVLQYSKATVEKNLEFKEAEVKEKELVIEKAREVFVRVADGTGCYNFDSLVRNLNIPRKELRALFENNKWICPKATDGKGNKILKPTALSERLGFTKYLSTKFVLPNGKAKMDFVITPKGYAKVLQQVGKVC